MATAEQSTMIGEIFSGGVYKRNQGRLVRQATFIGAAALVVVGCISMANTVLSELPVAWRTGIPTLLAALGAWVSFRIVNMPRFADFLIAVESEMEKVSWPEWPYLWRALGVVLAVLVLLTTFMWLCDAVWVWLFNAIGFLDLEAIEGR